MAIWVTPPVRANMSEFNKTEKYAAEQGKKRACSEQSRDHFWKRILF